MKRTQLYDLHNTLGAKIVPFAGFEMPIWYSGIKDEALAVRNTSGIFDVSHMGLFFFQGENAFQTLQYLVCSNLEKCKSGKMVYGMILNEEGGILDDVMVCPFQSDYLLIVNAGNRDKIWNWIQPHIPSDVTCTVINDRWTLVAVQGPEAISKTETVLNISLQDLKKFSIANYNGIWISRSGYTGEDGVELLLPSETASSTFKAFVDAGVVPCGLGARDLLRIEAGLPLYGHELTETHTPLHTRYAKRVVDFNKAFLGKEKLQEKAPQIKETIVGLKLPGRQIARQGFKVSEGGEVTSGTYSYYLDQSLAMAFVPTQISKSQKIHIDVRGKEIEAQIADIPFLI